jgi:RNA-directed DNA polymerase
MSREKSKWWSHEDEGTEAGRRGGATRSSDEVHESGWSQGVASSSFGHRSTVREEPVSQAKSFVISKQLVWAAYKRVKANRGAAGVDAESVEQFERELKDNLYKIWNRMSSGAYFPPPLRTVAIAKKDGGERMLVLLG